MLSPEVKTRRRLPALVMNALMQAAGYAPSGAVPIAVLSATGEEPIVALPLWAFRIIAGLDVAAPDAQLRLPLGPRAA